MILVESVRLRWWTISFAAAVLVIGAAIAVTAHYTRVDMNGSTLNGVAVPAVALAPIAMFLAMIYATSAGMSLNREAQTLALSWTKPFPRTSIAARIVAVDLIAVVATYAFGWLVTIGVVAAASGQIVMTPQLGSMLVLSLGIALMWYALIQATTSRLPTGSRGVVGFIWPGALLMSAINGHVNGVVDVFIAVVNVVNPLAYLNSVTNDARTGVTTVFGGYWTMPVDERAIVVWLLAIVLIALAIALWSRREA